MSSPSEARIYIAGLTLMQMVSEHFGRSSIQLSMFRTVNCIIFSFLTILNFANYFRIDANMYIKNVESSLAILHMLVKYVMFIRYKPMIEKILWHRRERFWNGQEFGVDIKAFCDNLLKKIKLVQFCVISSACITILLYALRPCFANRLILEVWMISDTMGFTAVVLIMQYYTFALMVPVVFGYDSLYLALCVDVVIQVKLLKHKLKQLPLMNVSDCKDELENCIKHHQFLEGIFKQMRNIYSAMLLFHYFITLFSSCIELLELILGHLEISRILSNFMNIFMLITQFAYYAFPAEFVAAEFADISKAIYMSRWYNCDMGTQRKLYLMMTRSQYLTYFSAAGFININIETFGAIIRKIVSFYTVLRNLLNT